MAENKKTISRYAINGEIYDIRDANLEARVDQLTPEYIFDNLPEETLNTLKGEKGDTGDKGDKGDAFTFDDFTVEQLEQLKGAKGDKGDAGVDGEKGEKGDKGDSGVNNVEIYSESDFANVTQDPTTYYFVFDDDGLSAEIIPSEKKTSVTIYNSDSNSHLFELEADVESASGIAESKKQITLQPTYKNSLNLKSDGNVIMPDLNDAISDAPFAGVITDGTTADEIAFGEEQSIIDSFIEEGTTEFIPNIYFFNNSNEDLTITYNNDDVFIPKMEYRDLGKHASYTISASNGENMTIDGSSVNFAKSIKKNLIFNSFSGLNDAFANEKELQSHIADWSVRGLFIESNGKEYEAYIGIMNEETYEIAYIKITEITNGIIKYTDMPSLLVPSGSNVYFKFTYESEEHEISINVDEFLSVNKSIYVILHDGHLGYELSYTQPMWHLTNGECPQHYFNVSIQNNSNDDVNVDYEGGSEYVSAGSSITISILASSDAYVTINGTNINIYNDWQTIVINEDGSIY